MRLGIISDIHANFEALLALSEPLATADKVLCLGDLVGYYCQPKEVIDYMRSLDRSPYLLNPGSVGQARDLKAVACGLIIDTETMTVEKIERPFDPTGVIHLAKVNGAGEWVTKHLL